MPARKGGPQVDVRLSLDPTELKRGADQAAKTAEGLGDSFRNVASGLGSAAGGIVDAFGIGGIAAGAALGAGLLEGIEREAIGDKLAGQLGLSEAEAERAGDLAGKVYSDGWGSGLDEISGAFRAVGDNLGDLADLSDTELESITVGALALASTFDEDVNGVIRAASQLLKNDLVDSAEAGLDVVTRAFQEGGDRAGDLLDTIEEYSPFFRDLGLSGDEALDLIIQGLDLGARNADFLGDAFKEVSLKIQDQSKDTAAALDDIGLNAGAVAQAFATGGPAAKQALGEIVDGLQQLDDPVRQQTAGVALFGTKFEDSTKRVLLGLDLQEAGFENLAGATDRLADAVGDNLQTRLETLKRRGLDVVIDASEAAIPALEGVAGAAEAGLSAFTGLSSETQTATLAMGAVFALGPRVAGAVSDMASSFRRAEDGVGGFSRGLSGIVSPGNLGLVGAAVAVGLLVEQLEAASVRQDRLNATIDQAADVLGDLKAGTDEANEAWSEFLFTADESPLAPYLAELGALGVSQEKFDEALRDSSGSLAGVNRLIDQQIALNTSPYVDTLSDSFIDWDQSLISTGLSLQSLITGGGNANAAFRDQVATTQEVRDAVEDVARAYEETSKEAALSGVATDKWTLAQVDAAVAAAEAEGAVNPWSTALDRLERQAGTAAAELAYFESAGADSSDTAVDLTADTDDLAESFKGVSSRSEDAADAIRDMNDAYDDLIGVELDAADAALDFQDALDDARGVIKDKSDALAGLKDAQDKVTEAEATYQALLFEHRGELGEANVIRELAQARDDITRATEGVTRAEEEYATSTSGAFRELLGLTEATKDHYAAQADLGASSDELNAILAVSRDAILDVTREAGLSPAQIGLLEAAINAIPEAHATTVTVDGSQVQPGVNDAQARLYSLKGPVIDIHARGHLIQDGIDDARRRLETLGTSWVVNLSSNILAGFGGGKAPRKSNHVGGTFRAPTPGGVGLSLLRDGEKILAPGERGGGDGITINVAGSIITERDLVDVVQRAARAGTTGL